MVAPSDAVWMVLIPTIPATLGVLLGFVNKWHLDSLSHKVSDLKESTDGKMDALLNAKDAIKAISDEAEFAKGVIKGLADSADPLYKIPTVKESKE